MPRGKPANATIPTFGLILGSSPIPLFGMIMMIAMTPLANGRAARGSHGMTPSQQLGRRPAPVGSPASFWPQPSDHLHHCWSQ